MYLLSLPRILIVTVSFAPLRSRGALTAVPFAHRSHIYLLSKIRGHLSLNLSRAPEATPSRKECRSAKARGSTKYISMCILSLSRCFSFPSSGTYAFHPARIRKRHAVSCKIAAIPYASPRSSFPRKYAPDYEIRQGVNLFCFNLAENTRRFRYLRATTRKCTRNTDISHNNLIV